MSCQSPYNYNCDYYYTLKFESIGVEEGHPCAAVHW